MPDRSMRSFWDERAEEDPFYFVDNRQRYGEPEMERFWGGGREAVANMLGLLGVSLKPTDVVVDIGCGVGRMTRALAERAGTVKGVDVSERMLEVARRENAHLENVEWVLGNGTTLAPIRSESVDCVFELVVFHHIPDPEITLGYIREIGRLLRPGGFAALQVSNDPAAHRPPSLRDRLRALPRRLRRSPGGQNDPAWRGSAVDLDRLESVAGEACMRLERVVGEGTLHCLVLLRRETHPTAA